MAGFINKGLPFSRQGYFVLAGDLKLPINPKASDTDVLFMTNVFRGDLDGKDKFKISGVTSIQIPDISGTLVVDTYDTYLNMVMQMPIESSAELHEPDAILISNMITQTEYIKDNSLVADVGTVFSLESNVAYFTEVEEFPVSSNPFGVRSWS